MAREVHYMRIKQKRIDDTDNENKEPHNDDES
jgi:hypothetical protein